VLVVAVVVAVVVGVVDGALVPLEPQATDSAPVRTAVAIPVAAANRRDLFFTSDIDTHVGCENCCDTGG
jgi:hypothetical protein